MDDDRISGEAFGVAALLLSAATLSRAVARGDIEKTEVERIIEIARDLSKLENYPGDPSVSAYTERLLDAVEQIVGHGPPKPSRSQ